MQMFGSIHNRVFKITPGSVARNGNVTVAKQFGDCDRRDRPSPDILRVLAIGSPQVVNNFVMTMFQLGYARPEEWSRQLPTVNPGEVMRILTKRVMLSEER